MGTATWGSVSEARRTAHAWRAARSGTLEAKAVGEHCGASARCGERRGHSSWAPRTGRMLPTAARCVRPRPPARRPHGKTEDVA